MSPAFALAAVSGPALFHCVCHQIDDATFCGLFGLKSRLAHLQFSRADKPRWAYYNNCEVQ
eukprot:3514020-Amphidinium_carterae.1